MSERLIRVEHRERGALVWATEVPTVGWMIEDGKVNRYPGDEAYERAQDPETPSGTIYWNYNVALIQFNERYEHDEAVETPHPDTPPELLNAHKTYDGPNPRFFGMPIDAEGRPLGPSGRPVDG